MSKKPNILSVLAGFLSSRTINENFTRIADAFDNTLSRDGSLPNHMNADFDMNSNDILNVNKVTTKELVIEGDDVSVIKNWAKEAERWADLAHTSSDISEEWAGVSEEAAELAIAVAGAGATMFSTREAVKNTTIPPFFTHLQTAGYSEVGDGGGALYKRVEEEPEHAGKVRSKDGAWWELAEVEVSVRMFGAKGNGVTDDTAAINDAITTTGEGGSLYFPEGVYVFSDLDGDGVGLVQLSGQTWFGDGPDSVLLLSPQTTSIREVISTEQYATHVTIRDLCIDGNRPNITPTVDLYSNFNLLVGPRGGRHITYKDLLLRNSWGRSLQTSRENFTPSAMWVNVERVTVLNGGTKGISATNSNRVRISGCHVEIDPYQAEDHPGGVGDGSAYSGSCFECNGSGKVVIEGNHGIQIGEIAAPGVRLVNGNNDIRVISNTITGARYLGFIQNANDVIFFSNTGENIRGNAFLVADEEEYNCRRVRIHSNTILGCTDAFVFITANDPNEEPYVECYIYDNDFIDTNGATHGIYNNGVTVPAGTCRVYAWGNNWTGPISSNINNGPAGHEIQGEPDSGFKLVSRSKGPIARSGSTNEMTISNFHFAKNTLGKNGVLRITALYSVSNNSNNKSVRVRFGGQLVYEQVLTTSSHIRFQIEITNLNSLTQQIIAARSDSGFGKSGQAAIVTNVDTSANSSISFNGILSDADDTITLQSYTVELLHAL